MILDRVAIEDVFCAIVPRAPDATMRLVGTASSVLRGVPTTAGDIDILFRTRSDIDRWIDALRPLVTVETAPQWIEADDQYFARLFLRDVPIELSTVEMPVDSDTVECLGSGPWKHFDVVPCRNLSVPAVASELRLLTELVRRREDRYRPLLTYLQGIGCDVDLVRRGLSNLGASQAAIERITADLTGHR